MPAADPRPEEPPKGPDPRPEAPPNGPAAAGGGARGVDGGTLGGQSPLACPHVALVFPQLRVASFHQEPAAPAGCLCSCIAAGLKNRSALRSFIDGAHCLYYNFRSNLKQRQEMERSTPYACQDWWHVDNDGRVGDGGAGWRIVVCGGACQHPSYTNDRYERYGG